MHLEARIFRILCAKIANTGSSCFKLYKKNLADIVEKHDTNRRFAPEMTVTNYTPTTP